MNLYEIRNKLCSGEVINNLKLRVVYYARVSTDKSEQLNSLHNQSAYFYEYIKNNNNWEYVSSYIDEGISGVSDIKRERFMQMIEDAKNNKFDLIITKEISRFSRNTLDSIKYTRQLLAYGVAVFFVNDNINTILPDAELRLTIMASLAQDEVRRLSERIKFGMKRAIKEGKLLGSSKIYGYRLNHFTRSLEIKEDEALVVRSIFKMYAKDLYSLTKISKILNERKMSSKKWHATTISRIITNPKYKGFYCGHKKEVVDYMTKSVKYINKEDWVVFYDKKIPSIVHSSLWDKANARLNSRHKKRVVRKYLYTSKIYCKYCHDVFYHRYTRRNNLPATWICSNKLRGKCDNINLYEEELDLIFRDLISNYGIDIVKMKSNLLNIYHHAKIDNYLTSYLDRVILDIVINKFIDRVLVSRDNNIINLEIILRNNLVFKENTFRYTFKRGYNMVATRRYSVIYNVIYVSSV